MGDGRFLGGWDTLFLGELINLRNKKNVVCVCLQLMHVRHNFNPAWNWGS